MKVSEIKTELEKVSKVIPELRKKLDEAYSSGTGKKGRIKLLWRQYEDRYREIMNSPEHRDLQ